MAQPPVQRPLSVVVIGARGIPDVEGGAEKNAEMLFPRVVAAGIRVTLLGLQQFIKTGDYRGVRLVAIRSRRFLKTDKIFFYLSAIPRVIRDRPDIVHLQGLGASLFLWVYKLLGCKTVVRYGSADYVLGKWGVIGRTGFRLAEYQTRFADAVIAVTPALADRLAASGIKDNVHVIPNALDAAEVTALPDPALVAKMDAAPFVLFVGRVTMQKNVDGLIRAFRRFREIDGRPFRLLIAGGLDDVGYVRDVVQPLLDDDVVLLDRCNRVQLEALYGRCDVFINASIHEGSSNATLEAISRRCPVIISDIPENLDFKLDPQAYFNPVDVESVAGCLVAAAREPDAFRPPHDRFLTWDDVARRTIAIYHAITKR